MRDPRRIEKIMELLTIAWGYVPDWRLGQLISNLQGTGPQDIFFAEDDVWEERLKDFIMEYMDDERVKYKEPPLTNGEN